MSGLIMAIQMIAALSLLVILHEFGHYIAARIFGIRVEKFYLFFNPKFSILTYNKKTGIKFFVIHKGDKAKNEKEKEQDEQAKEYCTYGIGWLPVGGYVKIAGMIDESMDTEAMKKPPQPYEFRSKPRWQRLIVMTAGVIMNLILGIVVLSTMLLIYTKSYLPKDEVNRHGIYSYQMGRDMGFQTGDKILKINGDDFDRFEEVLSTRVLFGADLTIERDGREMIITTPDTLYKAFKKSAAPFISANNFPFVVDSIVDSTGAWTAGVMPGDKIVSINGEPIDCFGELNELLLDNKGKEISLVVFRNGTNDTLTAPIDTNGILGIYQSGSDYVLADYTFWTALHYGTSDAIELLYANIKGMGHIFSGKENAKELSGPIGIAKMFGGEWIWERFWKLVGLISLILAFMNILPIPALDGGHVILLIYEMITRKAIPDKVMEKIQMVGVIILLLLMVLIFGNDIFKIFN